MTLEALTGIRMLFMIGAIVTLQCLSNYSKLMISKQFHLLVRVRWLRSKNRVDIEVVI